ncbi:response regulator [Thermodesulfobacteriota bacterium]
MTGSEPASELLKVRPDIPMILCTGYSEWITGEQAMGLGIRALVMKPILKRQIARTVRRVLDQDKQKEKRVMGRILVVDDDNQVREMLKQMLERDGHEVVEASDGNAAIKLYTQNPTDIIVTDIFMPDIGGIDTIAGLKGQFPDAKIIAISGGGGDVAAQDCLEFAERMGVDRTFSKPLSNEEFTAAVSELLEK